MSSMLRALLQLPAVSSHQQDGQQGPAQGHMGRGQMGAASPVTGILENLEKATKATEIMVKDLEKMKHMKGSWQ